MENQLKTLSKYLQIDEQVPTRVLFHAQKAISDQLAEDLQLAGKYVERFSIAYTNHQQVKTATEGIPIYGNWCGPGHGSGKPIDTLDSLCKQHDLCYRKKGYFNCSCDHQLVNAIYNNEDCMNPKERIVALAIAAYFKMAPCVP